VRTLTVTRRNAAFQQWQALLVNRTKRHRAGVFLVQGVRPIDLAVEHGWTVRSLLFPLDQALSGWARGVLEGLPTAERVALAPDLLGELGEKSDGPPELVAVVELPADRFDRIEAAARSMAGQLLVLVLDRPTSPGNLGSLVRSADAFGAAGLVVSGHAADPYDPKAVRASTGSVFALPVVRADGHRAVLDWVDSLRAVGSPVAVVGTDEHGAVELAQRDLTGPTVLVVGNETRGMSAGWREACDELVRIPMTGAASSLNAANAGTVALYEAVRQRGAASPVAPPH
jgi:TrmH family RNA methyltransferase